MGHGVDGPEFDWLRVDDPYRDSTDPRAGSPKKEEIGQVIERHLGRVRVCFERASDAWNRTINGRVDIKFVIAPDGAVVFARALENTTGLEPLACCIQNEVRRWHFRAPDTGGVVIVSYPFMLKSAWF